MMRLLTSLTAAVSAAGWAGEGRRVGWCRGGSPQTTAGGGLVDEPGHVPAEDLGDLLDVHANDCALVPPSVTVRVDTPGVCRRAQSERSAAHREPADRARSPELGEHRGRGLEVAGVVPLGEPPVRAGEDVTGPLVLSL